MSLVSFLRTDILKKRYVNLPKIYVKLGEGDWNNLVERIDKLINEKKYEPNQILILCKNSVDMYGITEVVCNKNGSLIDITNIKLFQKTIDIEDNNPNTKNIKILFVYSSHELTKEEHNYISDMCSVCKIKLMLVGDPDRTKNYKITNSPYLAKLCNDNEIGNF